MLNTCLTLFTLLSQVIAACTCERITSVIICRVVKVIAHTYLMGVSFIAQVTDNSLVKPSTNTEHEPSQANIREAGNKTSYK